MAKQAQIQIHDAKNKNGTGYRVKSVGKNGEILQTSEVLESVAAVKKHHLAMCNAWSAFPLKPVVMHDLTKEQKFAKTDYAYGLQQDKEWKHREKAMDFIKRQHAKYPVKAATGKGGKK